MRGVTFTIPGVADGVVFDGGWRQDYPDAWVAYESNRSSVRAGLGWRVTTTLGREQARTLSDYLLSVAEVLKSMTVEERGRSGTSEMRACFRAVEVIEKALA